MVTKKLDIKRIDSLDYLRGICALGVMYFHYFTWTFEMADNSGLINRIGLYAVSIFYILSGLTLYKVYIESKTFNMQNLKNFYIRRFFRIYPLLWIIISLSLVFVVSLPSNLNLILNYTGLFGIFDWTHPIGTGVWSIGNEIFFYVLFPVFWFLIKSKKFIFLLVSVFLILVYFAYFYIKSNITLSEQWGDYINPLNQVFLFVSGIGIGLFASNYRYTYKKYFIHISFSLSVLLFAIYPVIMDNEISLVTGNNRIVFSFLCISICYFCLHFQQIKNLFLHTFLKLLGECSYSIYLIHPIVFKIIFNYSFLIHWRVSHKIIFSVFLTFILSYISLKYFENKFVEMGNNILNSHKKNES